MSKRFIIDCCGIVDSWNEDNIGICENNRLSLEELCDVLNKLNDIADDKFDNYEYVAKMEYENRKLKNKLFTINGLAFKAKEYIDEIDLTAKK